MPTGTACKGFVGWLFLHHLQNRTNRAILTYIICRAKGGSLMFRLPIVKFFSRILNRITITVVLVALQVA